MGKNILETHLGAVMSVSGVMFGTILAGVLLGMAINRGTFLRVVLIVEHHSFKRLLGFYILTIDSSTASSWPGL